MKHIFKFLNINLQPHQHLPAVSYFLSLLLHSYYGPMLMKTVITELPPQWLSFETVWCCISSLLIGICWKGKFREIAVKWFAVLASVESICGLVLGMWLAFVAVCCLFTYICQHCELDNQPLHNGVQDKALE